MKLFNKLSVLALVLALVFVVTPAAFAVGPTSNVVVIPTTYTYNESLTAVLSGGLNLDLVAMNTVTVTANYNLFPSAHTQGIKAALYFSSDTAAMTGPSNLSAGSVAAAINAAGYVACNISDTGIPGGPGALLSSCFNGSILTQTALNAAATGSIPTTVSLKFFSAPGVGTWTGNLNYVAWCP